MLSINETHSPQLHSWVASANQPDTDFPIQNLPFGVFTLKGQAEPPHIGVAIGDRILDLARCHRVGLLHDLPLDIQTACAASTLNLLMAAGQPAISTLRHWLSSFLRATGDASPPEHQVLVAMADAEMGLPAQIGDYTDFYASIFHATNVGKLFRPDNPLLPNYKYVPIAYHGRASSIVPSGTAIRRPTGQRKAPDAAAPQVEPTQMLDYELEVGWFVGTGNALGEAIAIDQAEDHIVGLCLVNDWSARDIQAWEYQPLGPFLAKNFATSISPWIVTLEALAPFRCAAFHRAAADPSPLPYLTSRANTEGGGLDITLEVWLQSAQMQTMGLEPVRLSQTSFKTMYWTLAQMVTHHTSNGCNLRAGDLLASGTVSGATAGTQGCLLEMTQRGQHPIELPSGETRSFLQDGDVVVLNGFCETAGYRRIGFGSCQGKVNRHPQNCEYFTE
jgi:fumarylacetoacetase